MSDFSNGIVGFVGCILSGATGFFENLPQWVSVICSAAIAIVTCAIQIYRMVKNRDKDIGEENEIENSDEKEEEKDDKIQ